MTYITPEYPIYPRRDTPAVPAVSCTGHNGDAAWIVLTDTGEEFDRQTCLIDYRVHSYDAALAEFAPTGDKVLTNGNAGVGMVAHWESDFGGRTPGMISARGIAILRAGRDLTALAALGVISAEEAETIQARWDVGLASLVGRARYRTWVAGLEERGETSATADATASDSSSIRRRSMTTSNATASIS